VEVLQSSGAFLLERHFGEKGTMALNILLDKPGPYCPGATITGRVELRSSSDEAIAHIDINFTGRCKVKIRKHDHYTTVSYRSRGYYFSQHLSLYAEGKYKHKAGTYTWPFTFTIPDQASRQPVSAPANISKSSSGWRSPRPLSAAGVLRPGVGHELESDTFTVKPPFRASAPHALQAHPLPDSFAYAHSGFPADFEGRVEYTLVATLTRPSGGILFSPKNLEASANILVKSFRSRTTPDPVHSLQTHRSTHTISTLRLLSSNMDRKLTFLEKTRSVLNSSTIPTCTFQVTVATPRYLWPAAHSSDTLPLTIAVLRLKVPQPDKTDAPSNDVPTPIVKLTALSLWVWARTLLRDNAKAAIDQTIDYEDRVFHVPRTGLDIEIPVLEAGTPLHSPMLSEPSSPASESRDAKLLDRHDSAQPPKLDLGKILNLQLERDVLPPDFSTYNIYRSYTLGFKLRLEALGESIDVSQDGIKVRVLQELAPLGSRAAPPTERPNTAGALLATSSDNSPYGDGPFPPEPPPDASVEEDQLPQYEHHAPEGPLPAFEQIVSVEGGTPTCQSQAGAC
jgi:hypothetical protein